MNADDGRVFRMSEDGVRPAGPCATVVRPGRRIAA